MSAKKKASQREYVLVRHIVAAKRKDVSHLEPLLKAPFPGGGGSTCDGGSKDVSILGYASGRCLVAARFARQTWAPLYSNAASAEELFGANAASRRLEVAWFGFRPQEGWFFRLNSAGKPVVEFAQALGANSPSICKLVGVEPGVLKDGESGEQAMDRLCKHFEIPRAPAEIRIGEGGFEMVDAGGQPLKSGLLGYVRIDGPAIAEGESAAADALAEAIEECDADGIRAAVEQGASLTALPDTSTSPLLSALFKFDNPSWKECVELLIQLGCPVNGGNKEPPLVACVASFIDEPDALKAAQLLVSHGADVNAVDRSGHTALFDCVVYKRLELVRFLVQHGADPDIKDQNGVSPLQWLKQRYEEETGFRRRTEYAELLSELTGEPVARPETAPLRPELEAENNRFKLCLLARRILASLPAKLELKPEQTSLLAGKPWYGDWRKELVDSGFQFAGDYSMGLLYLSAFTNPALGFDAVISAALLKGQAKCAIAAYHGDGATTTVSNVADATPPEFTAASHVRREFPGASPAQLLDQLQELLQGQAMQPLEVGSFAARYTEILNQVAVEGRQRAERLLDSPPTLIDGVAPRYERLRFYYDFSGYDDPAYSTEKVAKDWIDQFNEASGDSTADKSDAVDAALHLAGMRHFQFAATPDPQDYIARGTRLALEHFQMLAGAGKGCVEAEPWFQFRALLRGLMLCALDGSWQTFKEICNAVRPKLASADTTGEEDIDFAPVLLLLVSRYRERALPKVDALETAVKKRRTKRPRLLLDVWRALHAGQAAEFDEALRRSLEHFIELQGDGSGQTRGLPRASNDLFEFAALPESLFHLAARERGLQLPPLPQPLGDLLLTSESIAR
jgi:hypothetical protein